MKLHYLFTPFLLSFTGTLAAQQIISGDYDGDVKLAYDNSTRMITGYYESYTGFDKQTNNPSFSCIFYVEGKATGKTVNIKTYYPKDKQSDIINGTLQVVSNRQVKIKLLQEHGGCWNVQHFADEPVDFSLDKPQQWIQIRYVNIDKAYFYSDTSEDKREKAYLLKGDVVCISKIESGWVLCTYYGKKVTSGWLRLSGLNTL